MKGAFSGTSRFGVSAVRLLLPIAVWAMASQAAPGEDAFRGNSHLLIDCLAMTALPLQDAEGIEQPQRPPLEHAIDLRQADKWTAQPAWLGNYTPHHQVASTPSGLQFLVDDGMKGTKWSHNLEAPIVGVQYVTMRYRARNLRCSGDYALYACAESATQNSTSCVRANSQPMVSGTWPSRA